MFFRQTTWFLCIFVLNYKHNFENLMNVKKITHHEKSTLSKHSSSFFSIFCL
jgi:hypothetical protein